MYIRYGSSPEVDPNPAPGNLPSGYYDCGSYTSDSNEQCDIPGSLAAGQWYVAVYAWTSFPSADLTASYTQSGGGGGEPSGSIDLSASVKGGRNNQFVNLSWSGASGDSVDIWRDGTLWLATANDGAHKDNTFIPPSMTYQVCEAGSSTNCSEEVTAQ